MSAFDGGGIPVHHMRVMVFVDGTNFLTELGKALGLPIDPHKPPVVAFRTARWIIDGMVKSLGCTVMRRYWFGSYQGSGQDEERLLEGLHENAFSPVLLSKVAGKEKGVDMALAIDLLSNAYNKNFDIGWLVAGDGDYIQLVKEAKRSGAIIKGMFLKRPMAVRLKYALDEFYELDTVFDLPDFEGEREELRAAIADKVE